MNAIGATRIARCTWKDIMFVVVSVGFMLGCISSSYRSARTVEPGSVSLGGGITAATSVDEGNGVNMFYGADGRAGIARGLDVGVAASYGSGVTSLWGDIKVQLLNHDLKVGSPILSLGLIKGYSSADDDFFGEASTHVTSVPVMFAMPVSETTILGLTYKFDVMSDEFIPSDGVSDPGHKITLGMESVVGQSAPGKWVPRFGLGVGYNVGELWENCIVFDVGVSVESP